MTARQTIEDLWDRATPVGPLLDAYRDEILAAARPTVDASRQHQLLADMKPGVHYKAGTVAHWYRENGYTGLGIRAARHDLTILRDTGHLTQHDTKGVRYYLRKDTP
ncbi:hypothetical protein ABZV65_19835 [Streptomyces bauhiniae]|uniref:hypothetical protein n=1 Tax=Streptomyces bauhiniae TaxID=2340725 RepID=UPI00339E4CD3